MVGYHAVNLAIHFGACLALFGLVRRTVKSEGAAFAVALLWAVNPLQTEAVTYIVQRAESLASLLYLLTLYSFVRAARSIRPAGWYALSALCCLLGMGTKEIVASAPVLVYAYDATFLSESWGAPWRRRRAYYLALAATWLPLACLVLTTHGRGHTVGFSLARPAWQYWLTQFPAVAHYLRLALWPAPLIFDRGYDTRWIDHPAAVIPYAAVLALLIARTGYELARRTPAGFLGLGFFAVLAPTSVVPGYLQTMAEHRMYLPLAAVIAGVVLLIATEPKLRHVRIPLLVVTVGIWGGLTYQRNRTYSSVFALWSDTVEKAPLNPNSQYNLGNTYADLKNYPAAIAHFRRALDLYPDFPTAYNNLGNALAFNSEPQSAERAYLQAIFLDPKYPDPHNNLGNIYLREGRTGDAIREYRATLALAPQYLHARHNLDYALHHQPKGLIPLPTAP